MYWTLSEFLNVFEFRGQCWCFVDLADQTFAWTDDLNNGLIGGGVLSDPFPTQAGRRYLLQMLIGSQIPLAVQVDYGGKSAGRLDHPGGSGIYWLRRSMVFIAPGPQTQVDIRGWIPKDLMDRGSQSNNASFLGVDYVSVQLMWRKSPVQWLVSGKRLPP